LIKNLFGKDMLCQGAMVQDQWAVVWEEAQVADRVRAEAEWEGRLQQVRAVIVFARSAEQQLLILLHSPAIK